MKPVHAGMRFNDNCITSGVRERPKPGILADGDGLEAQPVAAAFKLDRNVNTVRGATSI